MLPFNLYRDRVHLSCRTNPIKLFNTTWLEELEIHVSVRLRRKRCDGPTWKCINPLNFRVLNLFPPLQPAILLRIILLLSNFLVCRAESVVSSEYFKIFWCTETSFRWNVLIKRNNTTNCTLNAPTMAEHRKCSSDVQRLFEWMNERELFASNYCITHKKRQAHLPVQFHH